MTGPEQHAATLDELLAAGRVKSALLLKGDFTDDQRELARQVWEAGIRSRDGELAAAEQRASQLEHDLSDIVAAYGQARREAEAAERQAQKDAREAERQAHPDQTLPEDLQ